MGKSPSNFGPSRLRMSREDAANRLTKQIEAGKNLLATKISGRQDFETLEREYLLWNSFNETMLRSMFDTSEEWQNYRTYGRVPTDPEGLFDDIKYQQGQLEQIFNNLELYELTPVAIAALTPARSAGAARSKEVFVVHGHNSHLKEAAARLVADLGLTPVILHEQANVGRTIIQKLIDHARQATYAIALLTPDDVGRLAEADDTALEPRARQNVIMELGLFLGLLGPGRVCAVVMGKVKPPSDYDGVVYIPYDERDAWKIGVAKEMKAVGIQVDTSKLL